MTEGASLSLCNGETIAIQIAVIIHLTTTTQSRTEQHLHQRTSPSDTSLNNIVLRFQKQLTTMQFPTRGGHGRGWSRRRGRGRVTVQTMQSSGIASGSEPRIEESEDDEVEPIYVVVDDKAEIQQTPICSQADDGCAGSLEDVPWSQSRTIELRNYCDEDANEYLVRLRVYLPGPNLIGNDEKLGPNKKGVEPSPSVEYVDACRYRARASSSSSSTGSWEEYFDAVEYQPASHSPRPFNVIPPTTALSSPLNASAPEFIPNPPAAPVAKEWEIEPGFFTPKTAGIKNEINKAEDKHIIFIQTLHAQGAPIPDIVQRTYDEFPNLHKNAGTSKGCEKYRRRRVEGTVGINTSMHATKLI